MAKTVAPHPEGVPSCEIVRKWVDDHACDRSVITEVGRDKFRVNLYKYHGDIVQVSKLTRSFYLVVESGVVKDCTL
jgi:hypothetical protein